MRYYKNLSNGYIIVVGVGNGGIEISQDEYQNLTDLIKSKPTAENGYGYKLKDDLTWETYELPIFAYIDEFGCEITEEEYQSIMIKEAGE